MDPSGHSAAQNQVLDDNACKGVINGGSLSDFRTIPACRDVLMAAGLAGASEDGETLGAFTMEELAAGKSYAEAEADAEAAGLLPGGEASEEGEASAANGGANAAADALPDGVPEGWVSQAANNGNGNMWQEPGATGNANSVRIMGPTPEYPCGYVRHYNTYGQPIDLNGKPGDDSETHIEIDSDGTYPTPSGWWTS